MKIDLNNLKPYVATAEDIANSAAEDAWKERSRQEDRSVLLERVERERQAAALKNAERMYAERIGSLA